MSRGDRGERIYLDDVDRQDFIKTLAEACQKTGFEVHANCLMSNHFHLVVETPKANLVAGMRWLLSRYTLRLNHRHHLVGHWRKWDQSWGSITRDSCARKMTKPKPSAWWPRNSAALNGMRPNCGRSPRTIRRSWRWRYLILMVKNGD